MKNTFFLLAITLFCLKSTAQVARHYRDTVNLTQTVLDTLKGPDGNHLVAKIKSDQGKFEGYYINVKEHVLVNYSILHEDIGGGHPMRTYVKVDPETHTNFSGRKGTVCTFSGGPTLYIVPCPATTGR